MCTCEQTDRQTDRAYQSSQLHALLSLEPVHSVHADSLNETELTQICVKTLKTMRETCYVIKEDVRLQTPMPPYLQAFSFFFFLKQTNMELKLTARFRFLESSPTSRSLLSVSAQY